MAHSLGTTGLDGCSKSQDQHSNAFHASLVTLIRKRKRFQWRAKARCKRGNFSAAYPYQSRGLISHGAFAMDRTVSDGLLLEVV